MNLALLKNLLQTEWQNFWRINHVSRPWERSLAATIASGVPLFIGAWFGHMGYGLTSSLGGMVFLYLPNTPLLHRMLTVMTATTAIAACFFCGLALHFYPSLLIAGITVLAVLVTMLCRSLQVQPPGSLFFLMSAMIAAYMPHTIEQMPLYLGLIVAGSLWACVVAFIYSLLMLWRGAPAQPAQEAIFDFKLVIVDSLIIGFFIGLSIFVAQIMGLSRPYWVPVACIAVLQGINFRAVWTKQLHRIAGTIVGMGLAWLLLSLHLNVWAVCAMMMALSFIIETLVTRHYAAAVIFITPLTIFLAEAGAGVHAGAVNELINARAIDTIIGSVIGLFGGFCLHYLGLRDAVEQQLRKLFHLRKTS